MQKQRQPMRQIRGHHNNLHCCWITIQTPRYPWRKKKPNNPQRTNPSICPKCLQYQDIEEVHLPHLHLSTLCTLIHGKCCSTAPELCGVTTRLTCTSPHKRCQAHTYGCTPAPGSCTWIQTHMAAVSDRWDTHPQPAAQRQLASAGFAI